MGLFVFMVWFLWMLVWRRWVVCLALPSPRHEERVSGAVTGGGGSCGLGGASVMRRESGREPDGLFLASRAGRALVRTGWRGGVDGFAWRRQAWSAPHRRGRWLEKVRNRWNPETTAPAHPRNSRIVRRNTLARASSRQRPEWCLRGQRSRFCLYRSWRCKINLEIISAAAWCFAAHALFHPLRLVSDRPGRQTSVPPARFIR